MDLTEAQMEQALREQRSTENCIVCLNKAIVFTGNVLKENKRVIAGFCSKEHANELKSNAKGCFGEWKVQYGSIITHPEYQEK
jgi:hypothetical protein